MFAYGPTVGKFPARPGLRLVPRVSFQPMVKWLGVLGTLVLVAVVALVALGAVDSDAPVRAGEERRVSGPPLANAALPSGTGSTRTSPYVLPPPEDPLPVEIEFEREPAA